MHDGRKDFFAQKPAQRHVLANLCPHRSQGIGEADQALVLGALAQFAELWVVAVLLAAARIAPRGLQMAVGPGTDPDSV
jgi:hypothetical protein